MRDLTRKQFLTAVGGAAALAAMPSALHAAAPALVTRPIPKSKNKEALPVIGLGTAQDFGAGGDAALVEQKAQVIKELVANGGRIVDTAAAAPSPSRAW